MVSKVPRLFLPDADFEKLHHKKSDKSRALQCTILEFLELMYIGTVKKPTHKKVDILNS